MEAFQLFENAKANNIGAAAAIHGDFGGEESPGTSQKRESIASI